MKERPILFSGAMVRSLLNCTKSQTRRVVKPQPSPSSDTAFVGTDGIWRFSHPTLRCPVSHEADDVRCPYGQPGDRLWVKETFYAWGRWETRYSAKKGRDEWHFIDLTIDSGKQYRYPATMGGCSSTRQRGDVMPQWWKRPAIFMPRGASRIDLDITGVRVERLNDISEADAEAEGVDFLRHVPDADETLTAKELYWCLLDSINGNGSWAANPWVWAVELKRVTS